MISCCFSRWTGLTLQISSRSSRRVASTWLRLIRSHADTRPMRGLLYTSFWIRWLVDRGVRTSTMRIAGCTTDATFEGLCLPGLTSVVIVGGDGCDLSDTTVRVIATSSINLLNIELVNCQRLTCQSLEAIGKQCKALTSLDLRRCNRIQDEGVKALAQ